MNNVIIKVVIVVFLYLLVFKIGCRQSNDCIVDVLVVGGGTSGIAAGIQSARLGVSTLIIEETEWLGGMLTSAGVSAVDGNYNLPAGLWGEFQKELVNYYGGLDSLKTGWVSHVLFEPSIGNKIFHSIANREQHLAIRKNTKLTHVERKGNMWLVNIETPPHVVTQLKAKVLIDATELGDVAKRCQVMYNIGMENRLDTHEKTAPEHENNIIQDITYVAILKDYGKDVTISPPEGYSPEEFACACINPNCISPKEPERLWSKEMMITYGKLPNHKYMINWPIEGNDYYVNLVDMSSEERAEALEQAKQRTIRFVYFIQKELGFCTLGLADDEYPTDDKLPFIPYHRESRRVDGLVRFTLNHITDPYNQPDKLYRTCIAVGDYPVDHHHTRYQGFEELPDLYFHPVPSYGLPLGTLIPKETDGLIVAEKSISVSNIVNGTTRLQPVVLQIGQAAGILASLAVKQHKKIHEVGVRDVQREVLSAGGYLLPYLDVEVSDFQFKPLQRVGSTGIMKGIGTNVGWTSQTWFRADALLCVSELEGLIEYYPVAADFIREKELSPITIQEAIEWISFLIETDTVRKTEHVFERSEKIWQQFALKDFDRNRYILRGEMAVLLDQLIDPFHLWDINIKGELCRKR